MSNITDTLSSLPAIKGLPSTGMGVVQRLIARAEQSPKAEDAVSIDLGRREAPTIDDLANVQPGRRRAMAAYAEALRRAVPAIPAEREGFGPGKVIYGTFEGGKLASRGGMQGSYEAFSAAGPIKFNLGEFQGYALGNYTGVAWNPKTGEMYSFKYKLDENHFAIGRFKEMNPEGLPERKKPIEGKIVDGVANFENGMKMSLGSDGQVDVELPAPDELNNDSSEKNSDDPRSHDGKICGKGFMDKNGNLVVAFDNGGTIHAKYEMNDGKLRILGYETLGTDS
ncbi:MAG: hypothetical protein K1X79_10130 [Oligoflexia bacterium]|nr:hypothetical protein [Oligoflexia bacterium]